MMGNHTRKVVWGFCLGMAMASCMSVSLPSAMAAREPAFTSNLGGTPISCSVYAEQVALDGVHTNDTATSIIKKLGMPKSSRTDGGIIHYYYKGLTISLANFGRKGSYTAYALETSSAGHYTPDGVGVGMSEEVLSNVYGTADSVWTKVYNSPKLSDEVNMKNQARFNETVYTYNANACLSMSFIVRKGIISEIKIDQAE